MSGRSGRIIAISGALFFVLACEPQDTRPGFGLSGTRATELIQDWRFSNAAQEIFIETRTWYGLRHSTTIWCAELDGHLYIGSYDDDIKFWERNIARNPEARLRIEGTIYDVTITPLTGAELNRELDDRYAAKYDMADVFGDDLPAWRYYSVAMPGR
jgi:hypothetical protein